MFLHRFNTVIKICSMNRLVKVAKQIDTRRNEISKLMTYYRTKTVTSRAVASNAQNYNFLVRKNFLDNHIGE